MTGMSEWRRSTTKCSAVRKWLYEKQVPSESGNPSLSERDVSSTTRDPQDWPPKTRGEEVRQVHPGLRRTDEHICAENKAL
jgi:hypothetical protein